MSPASRSSKAARFIKVMKRASGVASALVLTDALLNRRAAHVAPREDLARERVVRQLFKAAGGFVVERARLKHHGDSLAHLRLAGHVFGRRGRAPTGHVF